MSLVELLSNNLQLLLVLAGVFLLTCFAFRKKVNLPPGPWGWPIVGNLLQIEGHLPHYAIKLCKKFKSDTVSLQLGQNTVVVLHNLKTIKQLFNSDEALARPDVFYVRVFAQRNGILSSDGELWKQQRRFALTVLRDFGMGKMAMDESIQDELEFVVADIANNEGKPYDVERIICVAVANIMCKVIFGRRYEYDDEEFIDLQQRLEEDQRLMNPSALVNHFPDLEKFITFKSTKILRENFAVVTKFQQKVIEEHKKTFDGVNIRDYIDAFLAEVNKTKGNQENTFTDFQLKMIIYDMFLAGAETTATALCFAVIYMLHNPDVQAKVQAEIEEYIGSERTPTAKDRSKMTYTEAVFCEVMRFGSIVPLSVPHSNMQRDLTIDGYTIPKGAQIYANTYAVHHDPSLWKAPEKFDPNRFLDANGKLTNQQNLIPFSTGRRVCLGESLARMEFFLFFTRLLQRFTFKNPDNEPLPSLEQIEGFVNKPAKSSMVVCVAR